jgi:hypothetical protein
VWLKILISKENMIINGVTTEDNVNSIGVKGSRIVLDARSRA